MCRSIEFDQWDGGGPRSTGDGQHMNCGNQIWQHAGDSLPFCMRIERDTGRDAGDRVRERAREKRVDIREIHPLREPLEDGECAQFNNSALNLVPLLSLAATVLFLVKKRISPRTQRLMRNLKLILPNFSLAYTHTRFNTYTL